MLAYLNKMSRSESSESKPTGYSFSFSDIMHGFALYKETPH